MSGLEELERIAYRYGLIPRYLREIVYLSGIGNKQIQIHEQTGYAEETIVKYRRKLREMDEEEARHLFQAVAEVKSGG